MSTAEKMVMELKLRDACRVAMPGVPWETWRDERFGTVERLGVTARVGARQFELFLQPEDLEGSFDSLASQLQSAWLAVQGASESS